MADLPAQEANNKESEKKSYWLRLRTQSLVQLIDNSLLLFHLDNPEYINLHFYISKTSPKEPLQKLDCLRP